MKQQRNSRFRNGAERHANRFATSASRSNIRYSLSDTHATPDGYPVKQIGEHTWLIEKAGIVVHKCPRNPFTGNRIFALSWGCQKACVLPENPASYRVVRTKSYLFNKACDHVTFAVNLWLIFILGADIKAKVIVSF